MVAEKRLWIFWYHQLGQYIVREVHLLEIQFAMAAGLGMLSINLNDRPEVYTRLNEIGCQLSKWICFKLIRNSGKTIRSIKLGSMYSFVFSHQKMSQNFEFCEMSDTAF